MKKKKIVLSLIVIVLILIGLLSYRLRRNHDYAFELYDGAARISGDSFSLSLSIRYLLNLNPEELEEDVEVNRIHYDSAIMSLNRSFYTGNNPLTEEIRARWFERLEGLHAVTQQDDNLKMVLKDEESRNELNWLVYRLDDMNSKMLYLRFRIASMTTLERCIYNWRSECFLLSKSVDFPDDESVISP